MLLKIIIIKKYSTYNGYNNNNGIIQSNIIKYFWSNKKPLLKWCQLWLSNARYTEHSLTDFIFIINIIYNIYIFNNYNYFNNNNLLLLFIFIVLEDLLHGATAFHTIGSYFGTWCFQLFQQFLFCSFPEVKLCLLPEHCSVCVVMCICNV